MQEIFDGINSLYTFFTDTEAGLFHHITAYLAIWIAKAQLFAMKNAWLVAQSVLEQLSISQMINDGFRGFGGDVGYAMVTLRVPDAVSILLNAHATKFVMRLF